MVCLHVWRQAFRVFDIDGDGLIDADELRQTMANLGEQLSETDVRAMIREADRNGDGKVDFDGTPTQSCPWVVLARGLGWVEIFQLLLGRVGSGPL